MAMSAVFELLADDARLETEPEAAIIEAFEGAEGVLRETIPLEAQHSGAVAVVALLRRDQIYIASAGDCRCVLGRRRASGADGGAGGTGFEAVQLSVEHNFENEDERRRVLLVSACARCAHHHAVCSLLLPFGPFWRLLCWVAARKCLFLCPH